MSEPVRVEIADPFLESAMPQISDNFLDLMTTTPLAAYRPGDVFGSLAIHAHQLFTDASRDFLEEQKVEFESEEAMSLLRNVQVARHGMAVSALVLELVPLVHIRDSIGGDPLDVETAGEIAGNSFDFIDTVINAGSANGLEIVNGWLRPYDTPVGDIFTGAIVDEQLVEVRRLGKFELMPKGDELSISPKDLAEAAWIWDDESVTDEQKLVKCPAHILEHPDDNLPYTRHVFDAMVGHSVKYLYPKFIPIARLALQAP